MTSGEPKGRRRQRSLSTVEIDLWQRVIRHVTPLPGTPALPLEPSEAPVAEPMVTVPKLRRFETKDYTPPSSSPPKTPPLAPLEPQLRRKLMRGNREIDARLDLHGMRQDEAHMALQRFLLHAQKSGARIVLVVTGKGRSSELERGESGVLKRAVPQWLRSENLRWVVVGFEEAGPPHGGSGALYIRLRRHDHPTRKLEW